MAVESARAPRTGLGMDAGGCRQKLLKIFSVGGRGRLSARVAGAWAVPCRWPGGEGLRGCTESGVGSSLLAPVLSESQALGEWWAQGGPPAPCAELCAGPRSRAPTWPAKGQRWPPRGCQLALWVPKMSSSTGLQGAPGPEPEVIATLSMVRRQHRHSWLGPSGQGPGSWGWTERRAGSWGLAFRLWG